MSKIVLIGGSSSLGRGVLPILKLKGRDVLALSSKECNVLNKSDLKKYISKGDHVVYFSVVNKDNLIKNINKLDLDSMIPVSTEGLINCLQVCSENEIESFTFISSILSDLNIKGASVYSANKCFSEKIVNCFVNENKSIRSNIIQLGYFDSGLCEKLSEKVRESALNSIPLKRFGNFYDLASCLEFCFTNKYLNGSKIKLSGGL